MAPFHNPFKHGGVLSPRMSTSKSPQLGQEQGSASFKGPQEAIPPPGDHGDSSKGRKRTTTLKKPDVASPPPSTDTRSKKDSSSPPAEPRSPTKLSKNRRGSTAAPSDNKSHGKVATGLASLGFRRPSLPIGMGALSFRRSSVTQDAPEAEVPPPVPDVSKWRGVRRKSSTREPPAMPSVLEGLGIEVENSPRAKQDGSLPPRIPTPQPPSQDDGHAYFDLTSTPPTSSYTPPPPNPTGPDALDPTPAKSRSPSGSKAPSLTSRRSQAPSARHHPLPQSDAESMSYTSSRPSSSDSNRPMSSADLYSPASSASPPVEERSQIDSRFAPPPVPNKTHRLKPLTLNPHSNSSSSLSRSAHPDDGPRTSTRGNPVASDSRRASATSAAIGTRRSPTDEGGLRTKRNTMVMSNSSKRNTYVDPELINRPLPQPAEMFALRPTVNRATQTPPQWLGPTSPPLPAPPHDRRSLGSFSHFQHQQRQSVSGSPGSVYPPSPSIYSPGGYNSGDGSRRTSGVDQEPYWDDGLIPEDPPDTPVTISTAFRRNSPPISENQNSQPVLIKLPGSTPPRVALDGPDERDEGPRTPTPATSSSMAYPSSQPIYHSSSVDEVEPPHHQFFKSTSKGPTPPATLTSSLGPPMASPKRRGSAWELPPQESAASIANKVRRPSATAVYVPIASTVRSTLAPPAAASLERSSSAPSAPLSPVPDSPNLSPTPSPPTAPASSFAEDEMEIPAAVPRRRASQPHLKVDRQEQARLRAQKGRSFFLVQALNNPTNKAKEQVESQPYESGDDSDDSGGESLFYASPKVGRK